MQTVAYILSAWCYLVAVVSILWLVPHTCRKYGLGAQVGVLLLAMALVVVGYEAWSVAEGVEIGEYWLFRKSESTLDMPQEEESPDSSGFGCLGKVVVVALAIFNIWHLAIEHAERQEKRDLKQVKEELLAEAKSLKDDVRSLKERLDVHVLREVEAKSDFDLFNEQFLRSRSK